MSKHDMADSTSTIYSYFHILSSVTLRKSIQNIHILYYNSFTIFGKIAHLDNVVNPTKKGNELPLLSMLANTYNFGRADTILF